MPIGCVATRRCAGWSATGRSPGVLPRPARWAALRPSGWLDRRTLLSLPICPAGGSTRCTRGDRRRSSCSTWIRARARPTVHRRGSACNGHFGCTCYHPLFVFNQLGDLERCALRPGSVHSAAGWRDVLEPMVSRYRGTVKRLYFRGDAAFANPEIYEFLEAEGYGYAIRLPTNQVIQGKIGYLLSRPVGRPPLEVRRYYASFTYQAQSWKKPRRVVEGRVASRRALPACRLHRHQPGAAGGAYRRLLQPPRHLRAVHQRGQGRSQVDAAVMPFLRRQRGSPSAPCPGVQPWEFHADAGDTQDRGAMVADQPAGEADQDRRQGGEPRALRYLPDG